MVVVVVDDFQSYRAFVVSELQKRKESQVIYEASDGVEAVRLANEHQPDLILLDIGLPKLNGIEAARQIREVTPNSKILFVSQEKSHGRPLMLFFRASFRPTTPRLIHKGSHASNVVGTDDCA